MFPGDIYWISHSSIIFHQPFTVLSVSSSEKLNPPTVLIYKTIRMVENDLLLAYCLYTYIHILRQWANFTETDGFSVFGNRKLKSPFPASAVHMLKIDSQPQDHCSM